MSTPSEPTTPPTPAAVNEHGYPDATPIADMSSEHQAAYWKHQSRKHEQRASAAPDAAELERLRKADEDLKARQAAELTETQRLQKEAEDARAEAEAAKAAAAEVTSQLIRTTVATAKQLTPEQAKWLQGSTKEELEASADQLIAAFGTATAPDTTRRPPVGSGSDVNGGGKTVDAGEARYKARHGSN
jgi:small-conductance mechanosensitive channel